MPLNTFTCDSNWRFCCSDAPTGGAGSSVSICGIVVVVVVSGADGTDDETEGTVAGSVDATVVTARTVVCGLVVAGRVVAGSVVGGTVLVVVLVEVVDEVVDVVELDEVVVLGGVAGTEVVGGHVSSGVVLVVCSVVVVSSSVVDGCSLVVVVSSTVVVVSSTVVVVSSTVVVVSSTVVVVSGTVVVVVGSTGVLLNSISYDVPYQRFGSPQHTPARTRYDPAGTVTSNHESNPNQSSFAATRLPASSYNHSIESMPYSHAYARAVSWAGCSNVNQKSVGPTTGNLSDAEAELAEIRKMPRNGKMRHRRVTS